MTPQFYIPPLKKFLVVFVLARLLFFPLSVIIALNRYTALMHDWIPIVVMIVFSLTNGYFSTLCMIWAPSRVSDKEQQVAGTMMVCCLYYLTHSRHFSFKVESSLAYPLQFWLNTLLRLSFRLSLQSSF